MRPSAPSLYKVGKKEVTPPKPPVNNKKDGHKSARDSAKNERNSDDKADVKKLIRKETKKELLDKKGIERDSVKPAQSETKEVATRKEMSINKPQVLTKNVVK